jgi:hypothetical protein
MSEPENFLSRWSRRKLEAEHEHDPSARSPDPQSPARPRESGDPELHQETAERSVLDSRLRGNERTTHSAEDAAGNKEPEFDITTLPSLESITAETDIRVFLQKGVPAHLTRAALRRAWAADPVIRDFIEMAENQWDFVTGSDLPGFGPLNATPDEVRRMVANAFGELHKSAEPEPAEVERANPAETPADTSSLAAENLTGSPGQEGIAASEKDQSLPDGPPARPAEDVVQRNEVDIAMQQSNRDEEYKPLPTRRPHGRALPQ